MAKKPITRLASEMARLPAAPFIPGVTWNNPAPTTAFGAAGSKPFVGGAAATQARQDNNDAYMAGLNNRVPLQNMNDLSSPKWWAKNTAKAAKENFFDPIWNMPKAFDPTSGLSPMERVTTGVGGGLAMFDVMTPFLPEGALANAMVKRAAERAAVGTGERSFEYGLHHSLTPGLKTINPSRKGFQVTALDAKPGSTYFWQGEGRDMSTSVSSAMDNLERSLERRQNFVSEPSEFYQGTPRTYITRVPKEGIQFDENVLGSAARRIEQPLRVMSEIDPMMGYEAMSSKLRKYGLGMQNYPESQYTQKVSGITDELANLKALRERTIGWETNPPPALPKPPPVNLNGRPNLAYTPEQIEAIRKARERG